MAGPNTPSWIPFLTQLRQYLGIVQPSRTYLDFDAGFTYVDDPANDRAIITTSGAQAQKLVSGITYAIDSGATPDGLIEFDTSVANSKATLPTPTAGRVLWFTDKSGNAAVNNFTILPHGAETINGAASLVGATNRQTSRLESDGTNWFATISTPTASGGGGALTAYGGNLDATSTSTQQWVSSISGASGTGVKVAVGSAAVAFALQFVAGVTAPSIGQDISTSGAGVTMSITAQGAKVGSGANGGNLLLGGGAKDGAGIIGGVQITNLPPAVAGDLRSHANFAAKARNGANTIDITLMSLDGSDNMTIGSNSSGVTVSGGSSGVYLLATGIIAIESGSNIYLDGNPIIYRDVAHATWMTINTQAAFSIQIAQAATSVSISQLISTVGAGATFTVAGQAAKVGSAANGGNLALNGGAKDGAGINGYVTSTSNFQFGATVAAMGSATGTSMLFANDSEIRFVSSGTTYGAMYMTGASVYYGSYSSAAAFPQNIYFDAQTTTNFRIAGVTYLQCDNATGFIIPNVSRLQWIANPGGGSPILTQAISGTGAGQTFSITAQAAKVGSAANGGAVALMGGAPDGVGLQGIVSVQRLNPGSTVVGSIAVNTTLSASQSNATLFTVNPTAVSLTMRIARAPLATEFAIIRNLNGGGTTITVAWATGTGIVIPSGGSVCITGDGTNAVLIMQGT